MLSRNEAILEINRLAAAKIPFFFFTDFLGEYVWVKAPSEIDQEELSFDFSGKPGSASTRAFQFEKQPVPFAQFEKAITYVKSEINIGNSFLVNLTFRTPITTDLSLKDIFGISRAKYKLRFKDQFVVFSPETFVKIKDGNIYSYPMKGTINALMPNAEEQLLNDPKEIAEHITITDLIRNDLSQIADKVEVTKFRFVTEVKTHDKTLLQVSSEVKGLLPGNYRKNLGNLLFKLLPAGSISGAPKPKTIDIIRQAENYDRGFYTGICGHFDGQDLDSGVMIRFIEKDGNQLYYKSGGGITSFSAVEKEYQELIDKIYLPV